MPTINQLVTLSRKQKIEKNKVPALEQCPQRKGVCKRVLTMTPKKPNSALRKIARVKLSNGLVVSAYLPGEGHTLQEYSVILVRGGRTQDLPGLKYKGVRGKLDFKGIEGRSRGRSRYGTKQKS